MHNFAIERSVSYFKNQTNLSTFENDMKIIIYITVYFAIFFKVIRYIYQFVINMRQKIKVNLYSELAL